MVLQGAAFINPFDIRPISLLSLSILVLLLNQTETSLWIFCSMQAAINNPDTEDAVATDSEGTASLEDVFIKPEHRELLRFRITVDLDSRSGSRRCLAAHEGGNENFSNGKGEALQLLIEQSPDLHEEVKSRIADLHDGRSLELDLAFDPLGKILYKTLLTRGTELDIDLEVISNSKSPIDASNR